MFREQTSFLGGKNVYAEFLDRFNSFLNQNQNPIGITAYRIVQRPYKYQ